MDANNTWLEPCYVYNVHQTQYNSTDTWCSIRKSSKAIIYSKHSNSHECIHRHFDRSETPTLCYTYHNSYISIDIIEINTQKEVSL